jgi:SusD/RagB-like outer membrane lipoprotein
MRKQLFIACMVLMAVSTGYSCKKGFEELNTDPINIIGTTSDRLLAPALVNAVAAGMSRNRSFTNELMQVTVGQSDGDNTVFRYAFKNSMSDYLWNVWYVQLTNFKQVDSLARASADADKTSNASYQGIGKIGKVWLFANLTDTYGDIPYFHALEGDQQNVMPVFDRQKDIYLDLFNQLEEANTLLAKGDAIVVSSDPVYKGDVAKWRKFANSLYLRLLLRISGKTDVQQQCVSKIKQIVENPAQYPIFQSNADCARLLWNGGTSTTDPYTSPFIPIRPADFRGPAICSFFLNHLVDWSDPRNASATPYGSGSIGRLGIAQASGGGFYGVPSGYQPGQGTTKGCYFQSNENPTATTGGTWSLQQNPWTGVIMQYAEVQFILAEAAAKGWITGTGDSTFFYQGIASAINYWVPAFSESISSANFATHIDNLDAAGIKWVDTLPLENKMEKIHLQKYYALFMTDLQQWFEYRRTGHPVLPIGDGVLNKGIMPARLVYPVYVQAANPVNYKAAVAAQGPDEISTQVWWQQP